jgi:predicted transcriptional regulator
VPRPKPTGPTDKELAILRVLWDRGPSTVRQVQDGLAESDRSGYTSLQKIMTIMLAKGLVGRDESGHSHLYTAATSQEETRRHLTGNERAFAGSARQLLVSALSAKPASRAELEELRRLIEELEGEDRE